MVLLGECGGGVPQSWFLNDDACTCESDDAWTVVDMGCAAKRDATANYAKEREYMYAEGRQAVMLSTAIWQELRMWICVAVNVMSGHRCRASSTRSTTIRGRASRFATYSVPMNWNRRSPVH